MSDVVNGMNSRELGRHDGESDVRARGGSMRERRFLHDILRRGARTDAEKAYFAAYVEGQRARRRSPW